MSLLSSPKFGCVQHCVAMAEHSVGTLRACRIAARAAGSGRATVARPLSPSGDSTAGTRAIPCDVLYVFDAAFVILVLFVHVVHAALVLRPIRRPSARFATRFVDRSRKHLDSALARVYGMRRGGTRRGTRPGRCSSWQESGTGKEPRDEGQDRRQAGGREGNRRVHL